MAAQLQSSPFRTHLPDLSTERFTSRNQNCYEYAAAFKQNKNPPWLHALYEHWRELLTEPFKGITNDGKSCSSLQVGQ